MFNDNHDNTSMARRLLKAVIPANQPDSSSSISSRPSPSPRGGRSGVKNALLSPRAWLLSLLALALMMGPMAPFATPPAEANTGVEIWSATLTVQDIDNGGTGCRNDSGSSKACSNSGVLTDDEFTVRGETYTIETIRFVNTGDAEGNVHVTFDKTVPAFFNLMTLHRETEVIPITGAGSYGATVRLPGGTNTATPAGIPQRMRITIADEHDGGYLDTGFGLGGKLAASFSSNSEIYDIAEQSDGKIVAVGFAHNGTNNDFALARYNPDGTLDDSFGTGGRVLTDFGSTDVARAVALQSDGKIVVAGNASVGGGYDFAVARYRPNGTLDTGFGTVVNTTTRSGKLTTNMGATDIAHAVAIDSAGRIVVAGQAGNSFGVARYGSIGVLNTDFDSDGKVTVNFGAGADHALDMAILANDKILLGGYATNNNGTPANTADDYKQLALALLLNTGVLSAELNTTGKVTTKIPSYSDAILSAQVNAIAVRPDGRILVGGHGVWVNNQNSPNRSTVLAQYKADGTLDDQFGEKLFDATTDTLKRFGQRIEYSGAFHLGINDLTIAGNGNIMTAAVGESTSGVQHMNMYPYSSIGLVESNVIGGAGQLGEARAVLIDRNGKIVLAGYASDGDHSAKSNTRFALARFHPGSLKLDTSFGARGRVTTPFAQEDVVQAVAVDNQDRIVVAGYTKKGSKQDSAIARYRPDGSVDTRFGKVIDAFHRTGQVSTDFGYGKNDRINAMAIDKNGKIVVAGTADEYGSRLDDNIFIARYTASGDLDTTFGDDNNNDGVKEGRTDTEFGAFALGYYDDARALAIQKNGKIVVAGCTNVTPQAAPTWHLGLARFNTDGSLDNTFGHATTVDGQVTRNGRVRTQFGTSTNSCANAVAVQPDGKIVVAGYSQSTADGETHFNIAVARYNTDGTLDEGFSGDGKHVIPFDGNQRATAVAVLPNGEIRVAGYDESNPNKFLLRTFLANGLQLNRPAPPQGSGGRFHDMTIDRNGRILVAGYASNGANNDFLLARYNANRVRDASFGENGAGRGLADFHAGDDQAHALTIDHDGNIVVAGKTGSGYGLARYVGYRPRSNDASLSALTVSYSADGSNFSTATLNPSFRPGWPTYDTAELPAGTTRVRVTPTASDDRATIRVEGQTVKSGAASAAVEVSNNQSVDLSVMADDGSTTRGYYITIRIAGQRPQPPPTPTPTPTPTATPPPPPGVRLTANATTANEGGTVGFAIAGISPSNQNISIPLTVTNGTAENGDYQVPSSVTIAAGSQGGQGTIRLNQDADADDETFTVSLGTLPAGLERGNPDSFTITIRDDDKPSTVNLRVRPNPVTEGEIARIEVLIDKARNRNLTIPLKVTAGSAESNDYTAPSSVTITAGARVGVVALRTRHDPDLEDETLTVALGSNLPALATAGPNNSVRVTIDDDEFESEVRIERINPNPAVEGETIYVVLGMDPPKTTQVTIPLTLTAGTAESGDFSSLPSITIPANQTEASGSFTANQDSDEDDETLTVALGGNLPALITAGSPNFSTVTIEDDERVVRPRQKPHPSLRVGNGSLRVNWFIKDDHSPPTGFDIEYRAKNTSSWTSVTVSAALVDGEGRHTITGLTNGTTYQIRVRAKNGAGDGPWSIIEEGAPVAPPAAPTGLTVATGDALTTLQASWNAVTSATAYNVRHRASTGTNTWGEWQDTEGGGDVSATSMTIYRLQNATTYEVQVRAKIGDSVGEWSTSAQGATRSQ